MKKLTIVFATAACLAISCLGFAQSSGNFNAACTAAPTTTVCTVDADCATLGTGFTCGTAGVCVGPNALCNFDLILSTLSANSFDFVVPVKNGTHTVKATWSVIGAGASNSSSSTASCVGPGILSVTQTKLFQQNGTLTF